VAGGHLLGAETGLDAPHFIQVGDVSPFIGTGIGDLLCRCGQSILIKGYLPANFLAIRIKCFRCGAITTTPGLPEGEILPRSAVAIAPNEVPAVVSTDVRRGAVLACQDAIARSFGLTRPRDAPAEATLLSRSVLESVAQEYDRLTDGGLGAHMNASPPAMGAVQGDYPFAWAILRLRQRIDQPGWSWLQQNDDALATMFVVAVQDFLHCWGQHPSIARLASPLAEPGHFLRTMTGFATAKLLFDAGNRVGFIPPTPGHADVQLHFSTAAGEALSLAMLAPDALQWKERDRRSPQVIRSAVVDALAAAQGRVNSRNPGVVVLSVSILQPDFDQALVDGIHAAFRAVGRKHRGVAAVSAIMPKVMPAGQPDRVGFGYAFYPIRNPHFAGENPIRLGSQEDFNADRGRA
jgi:hypothetical protein